MTRTAKLASIAVLALGLAGCSDQDPVEAETLAETLERVDGVDLPAAQCAADIIFGPSSGFTEDQIKEAEVDLAAVPGFEEFAFDALRQCGVVSTVEGPSLDS